jgi:D-citramalate synthase
MVHLATPQYIERYSKAVEAAGAVEITMCDGASGVGPEAWAYMVKLVRASAPSVAVGVHAHNVFGLGMAGTIAALHAGANVAEVAVNHHCAASGQADLAEVVAALEVIYGQETGIEMRKLTWLRRLVEDITGVRMAPNKPVTGEHAWTQTSQGSYEEQAIVPIHNAASPELFGNRAWFVLGAHSNGSTVEAKLDQLGVTCEKSRVPDVLEAIRREMAIRGRGLDDIEIAAIGASIGS